MNLFLPEITVILGALLLLLFEILFGKRSRLSLILSVIILITAGYFAFSFAYNFSEQTLQYMRSEIDSSTYLGYILKSIQLNPIFRVFDLIMILGTLFYVLLSYDYFRKRANGTYFFLVLSALFGAMILVKSGDWITLLLSLEILSFSLYALVAYRRTLLNYEAAFKYFLLGAISSSFLLVGIAFIYLRTGSFELPMNSYITSLFYSLGTKENLIPIFIGISFLAFAFAFKLSAVPFHFWTPDVFEGSPSPTAGFISTVSKTAAIGFLLIIYHYVLVQPNYIWRSLVFFIALLTIILGNIMALRERSLKKILAYSTIAHAGYAIAVLYIVNIQSYVSVLFFMLAYTFATFGAFAIVQMVGESPKLEDIKGLFQRNPFMAIALSIFMFSLAGFPPLAGFFAKFLIVVNVLSFNNLPLAIVVLLGGVVSAYYYLRIVFFAFSKGEINPQTGLLTGLVVLVALLSVIALGVYPDMFLGFMDSVNEKLLTAIGRSS